MPSPNIPQVLRQAWAEIHGFKLREMIKAECPDVEVRSCDSKRRHYKLKGKVRTVNLYASTGTISVEPHGDMKGFNQRLMMPERAIKRAVTIANIGY